MKVFALIGGSGTGKSTKAQDIARNMDIDGIIDDGLLISGKRVIGRSAKNAQTRIGASKRACFYYKRDAERIKKYIKKLNIQSLLILATSEKMMNKIKDSLALKFEEHKVFTIEELLTPSEIDEALKSRSHGNHAIPISNRVNDSKLLLALRTFFKLRNNTIRPPFEGKATLLRDDDKNKIVKSL